MSTPTIKPLIWVGSSLKDLRTFPEAVKDEMGHALFEVQCGLQPLSAKPLKGFGSASVLEIVSDYQTDAYRAVYTVKSVSEFTYYTLSRRSRRRKLPLRKLRLN